MVTRERVLELLTYEPDTGRFFWKARRGVKAGTEAGTLTKKGYRAISIDGKKYYAHRLAWLVETGKWPVGRLDHVSRVRSSNRFLNLREATDAENQQNRSRGSNNTSGYMGVTWHKQHQKWRSQISAFGRYHHLGVFDTLEEAAEAYAAAKARLHTFHPEVAT